MRNALLLALSFLLASCGTEAEDNSEICFVGDSITDLWDVEYHFPGRFIHKHGIGGSKVEDVMEWDLSACQDLPTVLLIGTNNIDYLEHTNDSTSNLLSQNFYTKYKTLVKNIKPSKLYAISILPRRILLTEDPRIINVIHDINDSLQKTLKEISTKNTFINAYPAFIDNRDSLIKDFFVDGIHLNADGYEALSAEVRKKL